MVPAGQLRRELASLEAGGRPGRGGDPPGPGGVHVPAGGDVGPGGPWQVAPAPEPAGADRLPFGDGPAHKPQGVFTGLPVPVRGVVAAGGRAAAPDPGSDRPLDGRGAAGDRTPESRHLWVLCVAPVRPRGPLPGPPGVRGELRPNRHPDRWRPGVHPHRLRGFGEPADGAPLGPPCGAGGGRGPAPGSAPHRSGTGHRWGGPGHGGGGWVRARARVRGPLAPAAHRFSGAAPRGGAP